MLIEAKDQVAHGSWSRWLTNNFELSKLSASRYMRLARLAETSASKHTGAGTIEEALGEQPRRERHAVWGNIRDAADRVNVTQLDVRQARLAEVDDARLIGADHLENALGEQPRASIAARQQPMSASLPRHTKQQT